MLGDSSFTLQDTKIKRLGNRATKYSLGYSVVLIVKPNS